MSTRGRANRPGPHTVPVFSADPDDLPEGPGAYVLLLELAHPLALDIATLPKTDLAPGWYAYAGSAAGPGGIRARVARHGRQHKKPHWHIDRLTGAARLLGALALPNGNECAALQALLALPGTSVPIAGFGSSDCADCPAHLVALKT